MVRRLPAPRDRAAEHLLRAGRDLITGREPVAKRTKRPGRYGPRLPKPEPLGDTSNWVRPDANDDNANVLTEVLYDTGATPERFDVELFERLNAEYAAKPIVPKPPSYKSADKIEVARRRIAWVHQRLDLRNKTTLEIGCGSGYESWLLAHNLGCDAYGVDVNARAVWKELEGERVHYECADLAVDNPFPANKFDVIYSFVVWEHVTHPRTLLQETYDMLKPGGLAWIRANLFLGPQASHRYREVNFPWPHLLFSEDVFRDWDRKHGNSQQGPAWVNRLTWDNYERYINEIGFRIRHLHFDECEWDEDFYRRFEDMLGRYSKRDLKRDYFLAILEKPA
jgi:SAM-dependent methyltransferase